MSLAAGIEQFLQPILGPSGARRLILVYCSNQNKVPDMLDEEDLKRLGIFLREHLRLFVGAEQADQVIKKLSP